MPAPMTHWSPGEDLRTACGLRWHEGSQPHFYFKMYNRDLVTCKKCLRKLRVEKLVRVLDSALNGGAS